MFACSPVKTEKIFRFNNNHHHNNNNGDSSSSNKKSSSSTSSPYPCNNPFYNALVAESDQQKKRFQQFHEASLKRTQLKQEIQRRHQLCAENERQSRERTERQKCLKKAEECNALRKFYELKSAQLKNNSNDGSSLNSSLTSNSTSTSFSFSNSSKNSSRSFPSKSRSLSIKKFQAAYKIHSFIKHHIEKRKTQKIIACLIKLRSIQNRLVLLKSINLRARSLTFDSNHKNKVLAISPNNKAFLLYKDSILKVINQLDTDFTDELYLVRERKNFIKNIAINILKELDNERNLQYEKFKNQETAVDDFVIL